MTDDEARQTIAERAYQRHKQVYDEAGYSRESAVGEIRLLVDDIADGLPEGPYFEQRLAWIINRMEIKPPIKREMTDETRQALVEVERRLNDRYTDTQRYIAALVDDGADPVFVAHQQGLAAGIVWSLHLAKHVRSSLGNDKQQGPPIVTTPDYLRPAKIEHVADAPFPPKRSTLGDETGAERD